MIRLLPRGATPATLISQKVTAATQQAAVSIGNGGKATFPSYWLEDDVRGFLFDLQDGKCAYCETRREMKRESDVEHFRPKGEVHLEPNHPGYWWLAYSWENYFYACKPCNQGYKKTQFPLLAGGIRAVSPAGGLALEEPVLINPMIEN